MADDRRGDERCSYRSEGILVVHSGGWPSSFVIHGRNLSANGMVFLHAGEMVSNTGCTIFLQDATGKFAQVDATVIHCRSVRGHIHEIGVQFYHSISLDEFVHEA